jgi:hypothetical protein
MRGHLGKQQSQLSSRPCDQMFWPSGNGLNQMKIHTLIIYMQLTKMIKTKMIKTRITHLTPIKMF